MAELELLKEIAQEIKHMRVDLEELKDLVYPPEEHIREEAVRAVKESEKHYREGKFRELSEDEVKTFFT